MDTALKFQAAVSLFSVNGKADLLDPAQLGVTETGDLHIPAPGLGVHGIHTVEGICKQRRLLAAHASPNLYDDVFPVVGIPGQQQDPDLLLQTGHVSLGLGVLLLGQLLHIRIGEEGFRVGKVPLAPFIGPVGRYHRLQLPLLPVELCHPCRVGVGLGRRQAGLQFGILIFQRSEFLFQHTISSNQF